MNEMSTIEKMIILALAIIVAIVIMTMVFAVADPVSPNCRRACEHVDGAGWNDCVMMCLDKNQ